jgi:hypothetical protein
VSSNNDIANATRRRLFKALIGTGAAVVAGRTLPEQWMRPVVEAVIVPAHAQATGIVFGGAGLAAAPLGLLTDHRTRFARLTDTVLDVLAPKALATAQPTSTVCAVQSGNMIDVTLQRSQNNVRRQGLLNTDGTPGTLSPIAKSANCPATVATLSAFVSGFTAGVGFTLNVTTGSSFSVYVPLVGTCPGFATLDGVCPYE